ncbi:TetR/AcrR family transcriptional regulator [Frankia nepalensis]|uniref:TetR/AcrR family transcriptional regulator n=1 Tax=Frankia nepalensis TaxID=1836974 RepID=UPI001E03F1E5|nr:helix-turn-helix domain-containing protein [Frankia nepalensis]MBL7510686.1 helix-turn-helix transcriptional regulator [Frankia nepalensis]
MVAAATLLLERDGFRQFSMRRLAAELGVAPTAIYWHVGNRDELLDVIADEARDVLGRVSTVGQSPLERVMSTASALVANINEHRGLVELAHQRGILLALLGPARQALAAEFAAAGLGGLGIVDATNAVVQLVGEHVTFEHYARRWPEQTVGDGFDASAGGVLDEAASAALARSPDRDRTFVVMLRALVAGLLAESDSSGGADGQAVTRTSAGDGPIRAAAQGR